MKKVILILVAGLLLSGCASEPYNNEVIDKNENYIIITHDVWGGFKGTIESERVKMFNIASSHCTKYNKFAFWYADMSDELGRKFFCRATPDKNFINAELYWTNYDSVQQIQKDLTFTIKDKKEQCTAIGFAPATEKFADCVLRLVELDVKSQQATQIALAQSQGNQQVVDQLKKQRSDQSSQYFLDLGEKLLNPQSTVSAPSTSTCRVIGSGAYKTVNCW